MKKIILFLLILCLTLPGYSVCADGATVSAGSVSGNCGDIVSVPVVLSGNTGFASLGIEIGYDRNALELVEVTENTEVGGSFGGAPQLSKNPYNLSWYSASDITFNGSLAVLKFRILADEGEHTITVDFYKGVNKNYTDGDDVNFDEDYNSLNLTYKSGKITVNQKNSLTISRLSITDKTEFTVLVTGNIKGKLIAAVYDEKSGILKDVKTVPAHAEKDFSFNITEGVIKVFWLNNGLCPVIEPKVQKIN